MNNFTWDMNLIENEIQQMKFKIKTCEEKKVNNTLELDILKATLLCYQKMLDDKKFMIFDFDITDRKCQLQFWDRIRQITGEENVIRDKEFDSSMRLICEKIYKMPSLPKLVFKQDILDNDNMVKITENFLHDYFDESVYNVYLSNVKDSRTFEFRPIKNRNEAAFSYFAGGLNKVYSYIMTSGSISDISSFIHELGHVYSFATQFRGKVSLNRMTLDEVESIFPTLCMFEYLIKYGILEEEVRKEQIGHIKKIESIAVILHVLNSVGFKNIQNMRQLKDVAAEFNLLERLGFDNEYELLPHIACSAGQQTIKYIYSLLVSVSILEQFLNDKRIGLAMYKTVIRRGPTTGVKQTLDKLTSINQTKLNNLDDYGSYRQKVLTNYKNIK